MVIINNNDGDDINYYFFNFRAPGCQRDYECSAPVNTVVLHPNQAELISGDQNGSIRVWDLISNTCSRELVPDGEVGITSLTISSDGGLVVASNTKGKCFVWRLGEDDTSRFEPLQKIEAHNAPILKTLFSPDTKLLATCSADHTVKIWNTKKFNVVQTLNGHQRWVWDCAFSNDSAYLVTGSSDHLSRLWDLHQGDAVKTYSGHIKAVNAVALNDLPR